MRIYAKKTKKNKIKQFTKRLLIHIFVTLGIIFVLNCSIEFCKKIDDFHFTRTITIENMAPAGEVKVDEAQTSPVEKPDAVEGEDKTSSLPPARDIKQKIYETFKEEPKTALAIFRVESKLDPRAQGFNCYYEEAGKPVSQACRKGDEDKAWSTDCGLTQINIPGKICPSTLFDPDINLKAARKKYEARNWQPWSAWKSKAYLAYLNN